MSADGSITMNWADGEYKFRIAIGQFRELQENVNGRRAANGQPPIGPATLLTQLKTNNGWPDDVRDVLRLGLIGGGMSPIDASKKMRELFDTSPLFEHTAPAFTVFLAALVGPPGDELSKKKDSNDDGADEPVKFSAIYGNGAALGYTPAEVDACSFWQLRACVDGFNAANGAKTEVEPPSDTEFEDMLARHGVS